MVRGTSGLGNTFQRGKSLQLDVFTDAEYISKATNRFMSGGVVPCGGSAVNCFSTRQKWVIFSTTEVE